MKRYEIEREILNITITIGSITKRLIQLQQLLHESRYCKCGADMDVCCRCNSRDDKKSKVVPLDV